jgi:hypothetical protein
MTELHKSNLRPETRQILYQHLLFLAQYEDIISWQLIEACNLMRFISQLSKNNNPLHAPIESGSEGTVS